MAPDLPFPDTDNVVSIIIADADPIDAVIEMPDGKWGAFEIKLGANQIDDAAVKLIDIKKKMDDGGNGPSTLCVICGLADHAYRRDDGVYVVPITSLRP